MSDPGDDSLLDLGAQCERTALSWQRTGFSAVALGALLVHHDPGRQLPGLLLLAAGALSAGVIAPVRYRRILRAVQAQRSPAEPRVVLLFTALMGIVTVTAQLAVVFG